MRPDIYTLPSPSAFLDEIEEATFNDGVVIVRRDPTLPEGLEEAVVGRLREHYARRLKVEPGDAPHQAIAQVLGCDPTLEAVCADRFSGDVILLEADSAFPAWETFLDRMFRRRQTDHEGIRLIWMGPPFAGFHDADVVWGARLRRADAAIWVDLHAPPRNPVLEGFAAALAIELCGWRLDLAAQIVRLRAEELLDPLDWLEMQADYTAIDGEWTFAGKQMTCPLQLYDDCAEKNDFSRLESRVWRAQLTALFPWMEDQRCTLTQKHRRFLKIDAVAEEQGLESVDDLEFGALKWQLNKAYDVPNNDKRLAWRLSNVRNRLAHRRPAEVEDLEALLSGAP